LKVTLSGEPLDKLNELEFIDGKIFANVWMSLTVVRINPKSGCIDGLLDLSSISPKGMNMDAVANGLAWDAARKKLYVTGKLWPKVFELEILSKNKL
jgi:glutamine cyclotransferase